MKTIQIKDLKIGDTLPDYNGAYGVYVNRQIAGMRWTKGGRAWIVITETYKPFDGGKEETKTGRYSHGALSETKEITII